MQVTFFKFIPLETHLALNINSANEISVHTKIKIFVICHSFLSLNTGTKTLPRRAVEQL